MTGAKDELFLSIVGLLLFSESAKGWEEISKVCKNCRCLSSSTCLIRLELSDLELSGCAPSYNLVQLSLPLKNPPPEFRLSDSGCPLLIVCSFSTVCAWWRCSLDCWIPSAERFDSLLCSILGTDEEDWLRRLTPVSERIGCSVHLPCSLVTLLLLELCCKEVGSLTKIFSSIPLLFS